MTLMSLTAYAETHEVKKQSAAEWKARGYLVMDGTMVDVEASDRRMEEFAKGRFRCKAHGGRRAKGVRGAIDRPGMGYGPRDYGIEAARTPHPADDWHPLGNPNTLSSDLRAALDAGDKGAADEALAVIQFSQWEDACTAAGWDRWPATAAAAIAADLGLADRAAEVGEVLHRQVRARLASLGVEEADVNDPRLTPR